jgi:hypothetical protein
MQLCGCIQTVTVTVTCTVGNSVEPLLRSMHHAPASPSQGRIVAAEAKDDV